MANQKPNVENKLIEHRAGVKVQTWLDRRDGHFWGDYAGMRYEAKTSEAICTQIYEAIEASLNIAWLSVICVEPLTPFASSVTQDRFVGFEIERLWVGLFPDGKYRSCQWDGMAKGYMLEWACPFDWYEQQYGPFIPPVKKGQHKVTYYLPYSEAHWKKLMFLQEQIKALSAALSGFFEGLDMDVILHPQLLLALPEPTTIPKKEEVESYVVNS